MYNKRKDKTENYNSKKDRIIYVLLSPTDKKFYINQCLKTSFRETYRHNIKGRREDSQQFVKKILPARPCPFILENIHGTKSEAYQYILIWIRIFLENGYICYNNQSFIELSKDLFFENRRQYEERKKENLEKILSCENCIIPIYKNVICMNSKK